MLRLDNVSPEEMPEVVRIASELYEQDKAREAEQQQRQATVDAAAEIGLPEEYMQRAATEWYARRIEQIQRRRNRRTGVLAVAGATIVLGAFGMFTFMSRASHPAVMGHTTVNTASSSYPFSANQWKLNTNPGTQASAHIENGVATVRIEQFSTAQGPDKYFANFNTTIPPKNLTNYNTVRFQARGSGLGNIRLYLENGQTERWRSPSVPLASAWQPVTLSLDQFDYQTRADRNGAWQKQSYRAPEEIERLSFKLGDYVNDANAQGEVSLRDVDFERVY